MKDQKYIRFGNGEKEYYDLTTDPIEIHSQPETADQAARDIWEQRLDDLYACKGVTCQRAENAPLLPAGAGP